MKTIVRPSRRAFFNGRPDLLLPVSDRLLIAFPRPPSGPLRAPSQADQNLPHVPDKVFKISPGLNRAALYEEVRRENGKADLTRFGDDARSGGLALARQRTRARKLY